MKNSRLSNSMSNRILVLSMMILLFIQMGISTSFADDLVKRAQESMVEMGIDPGPIDGIWGPLTRGGVIEFQKNKGLTVSGRLDDATKKLLLPGPDTASSDVQMATKQPVPGKSIPEAPAAPAVKQKVEEPEDLPKQMAEAPEPVVEAPKMAPEPVAPPQEAAKIAPKTAPAPQPKMKVASSGVCPQPRKTKSAPSSIAKQDKTGSANLENGRKIYTKSAKPLACKQCHGDKGDGNGKLGAILKPPPRNFTCNDTMKNISVGQMFWIIKNGSAGSGMVAHKKTMKDSEIWDVVKYLRSTFMAGASSAEAAPVSSSPTTKSAAVAVPVPVKPEPVQPVAPSVKPTVAETSSAPASAQAGVGELPKGVAGKGKYEESAVSSGGSISGVVHFNGNVPAPIMEDLSKGKNVEFCATHPDTQEGNIRPRIKVAVAGGMLKDTVVFIQNIESGKAWPSEVENFDFKTCDIFPKVSVVRKTPKGVKTGLLTITNQDEEILHNPHGYSVAGASRKTLFNKPLPSKGDVADVTKTFKRFKVKKDKHFFLQCDQHNFMEADGRVVWNPYYSISGSDGAFKLDQIPAGKYWVTAWHPYLGEVSKEVTVSGGADAKTDFVLAAK